MTDSYATDAVSSSVRNGLMGGLLGTVRNSSTVTTSFATCPVAASGNGSDAGGLVGEMATNVSTVSHSYAAGAVKTTGAGANNLGGLVGQRASGYSIRYSYAVGPVTATSAGPNAEAGEHPLTLPRCANGVWTLVAGSERRGDGIAAVPVCAAGVMEYGLFAVAYTRPQLGPVSNLAAPGDAAGAITLTLTPGANAAAHWIAGVIQTDPYRLAIWQIAGNPGSQAFSGLDNGAS